jgi:hypothetical protein
VQSSLEQRALAAAAAVATANGLVYERAVILQSRSNVLIHLHPVPVVARVMTGTVVLHDEPRQWLEREVAVLEFLAPSGLAVTPSPLIAPGPYQLDGLWMTFSELVPDVQKPSVLVEAARLGELLRTLHDELRAFAGALADLGGLRDDIERLFGLLRPTGGLSAAKLSSLQARLQAAEYVFGSTFPVQALHGDASVGNLLHTAERLVWNDFEDTFRGPVHWDLAGYVMSMKTRGASSSSVREALDSYGWGDEEELRPFIAAHEIYDEIWALYDSQRRSA